MMPGVTYFPLPSITTASVGTVRLVPTETILPPCSRIAPFRMVGPAAVMTLTFRISVGRDANGTYVLGNGSALGTLSAPAPGAGGVVVAFWANTDPPNSNAPRARRERRVMRGTKVERQRSRSR